MKSPIRLVAVLLLIFLSAAATDAAGRKKQPVDTVGLTCRGVMETFAKVSDGLEQRLDFYKSKGLTHYFYSPSDDKYCSRWGWKFLYNDSQRHSIRALVKLCSSKGIEFVWTVNPGERYNWTPADYKFLLDKLIMMSYNGIRSFAVDFTDHPGDHRAVRDSLVKDFVMTRKNPVTLYVVDDMPQVEYPSEGHSAIESLMRGYHFDDEFIASCKATGSILCTLSEYDEFAKLAISATADCARNPGEYSPDRSMADAIEILDEDVRGAFLTFLKHTGEVNESSSVEVFTLDTWSKDKADALYGEFDCIEKVPEQISSRVGSDFIEALRPWFVEFGRLGTRGKKVLRCMECFTRGNIRDFWTIYISAMMTPQQEVDYQAHPVGANKLHPFCCAAMEDLKEAFTRMLTGGAGFQNLASTLSDRSNAALDSDFATSVDSEGHIEFAIPAHANTCHLLTGPLPEGKRLFFRQLRTDGSLAAEFILDSPSTTFDIKNGAVKVDIIGDVDIYECIFVYL